MAGVGSIFRCRFCLAEAVELARPVVEINMRIFPHRDDDIGIVDHRFGQVTMRIQHNPNGKVRADLSSHPAKDVAFTVEIVFRDHRTMQIEQDETQILATCQIGEQGIAQFLVNRAHDRSAGAEICANTFEDAEAIGLRKRAQGSKTAAESERILLAGA